MASGTMLANAMRAPHKRVLPTLPRGTVPRTCLSLPRHRLYSVVVDAPIPTKTKLWNSADEAVKDVKSGDTILSGGKPPLPAYRATRMCSVIVGCVAVATLLGQALDYVVSRRL